MPTTPLLGSYGDISGSGLMFRNRLINGDMASQELIPVLVSSVKELKAELDAVKAELAELKK